MSGRKREFTLISEDPAPAPEQQDIAAKANTQMLLLALSAVSKRALTAITNLFTLGLVASAWWLWKSVLPDPSIQQLAAVAGYAVFCVVIDMVRRKW